MITRRERILATLNFETPDRVPLLGGWVIDDGHQQVLAGCAQDKYWQDPVACAIEAHRALDVDGMIMAMVPKRPGEYRDAEAFTKEKLEQVKQRFRSPEDVLAYARSQPSARDAVRDFDATAWRAEFRSGILTMQQKMGDMVYLPTLWEVVHPKFEWYWDFGYENYLMFMHLYPEAADEFFARDAAIARRKAEIVVQVFDELDMVPLTLIGTDICGGGGPVVSPQVLRECYFPHVRSSLEPLREVGIKTVWHSDGDFRLIVDDLVACGVSGFQGFQEEYGVDIVEVARHRTCDGEKLTIWAGPSVTTTLPFGTVKDVCADIERIIDALADTCALFILPANNILPDCPVENIKAMHRHAARYSRSRRT